MYEDANVEDELLSVGLGTGFGAVEEDARALDRFQSGLLVDSESEALSHASSSPQSATE